ncbi:putative purple acid phosphatase 20 [Morella rubra]|uniref:acid phosphatase n=1 Tax=Morella rubra TaxID=262757 RepID=A0A6A1WE64_9ROSI|nr:putative purple acid phosphatase 20 [Morella rubra]
MAVQGLGLFLVSTGLACNGFLGNISTYIGPPARPTFFAHHLENLNSASPQQTLCNWRLIKQLNPLLFTNGQIMYDRRTISWACDLGQTGWITSTLQHIAQSNYDMLLLPRDLSYADSNQPLWDSFGRVVESQASQRPWMVTQGNHEIETNSAHSEPFTAYSARWRMPFEESGSNSNLYYSFDVAGVHVIMLGSYTDFDSYSAQYNWLEADLSKIDRNNSPWTCVYNGKADNCGPVHITIGIGGNREGLATKYQNPQPAISLFREVSFGHGQFEVVNATQALWTWHRNQDDSAVVSDSVWLTSLSSNPAC